MTNQSELKKIIDLIINHTLMGTNATLDWRNRDELTKQATELITANYTQNSEVERLMREARIDELQKLNLKIIGYKTTDQVQNEISPRIAELRKGQV